MNTSPCLTAVILALGVSSQAGAQSWLTNGLVAYYPFNGNANDESGNGHHAIPMGTGTQLTNGVDGAPTSAYWCEFPGGINYLEGSGINLSNSSLSVTLWFKKDYTNFALAHGAVVRVGVVGLSGGETGRQLNIMVDNGGAVLRFSFFFDDFDVNTPVGNGHWSHIACTFDNATMERRIYVDGALIGTNIAIRGFTGPDYFDFTPAGGAPSGLIDQARFYDRVLSSTEVAALCALESGPRVGLIKAVKPTLDNLYIGTNYQLQLSGDLLTWTNHGVPFTATNTSMVYPQYWDVDNWGKLFFRVQVAP
jgi:hypothetical protein